MFLLILACITVTVNASEKSINDKLSKILEIIPDKSTKYDLENLLGKPTSYVETNVTNQWSYTTANTTLTFVWNTTNAKVQTFNYRYVNKDLQDWKTEKAGRFDVGNSTLKEIIQTMGQPNGLIVGAKTQSLRYEYKNCNLSLEFKNNVLLRYSVDSKS